MQQMSNRKEPNIKLLLLSLSAWQAITHQQSYLIPTVVSWYKESSIASKHNRTHGNKIPEAFTDVQIFT